jgi:ABC-type molybdate transport system ATPase subunit
LAARRWAISVQAHGYIVCIRPEEIGLARLDAKESSAGLNSFTATVANVSSWLSHNRVELKCEGVSMIAFVQRARFLDLALRHGDEARVFSIPQRPT